MQTVLAKQTDHEHRVFEIWKAFRDAHGPDCAYHLSHAGSYLALGMAGIQLSEDDRAWLLECLECSKASALSDLPKGPTREDILRGLNAYADQIQFWSEAEETRAEWGDALADVQSKARIFRNTCHNLDLEQSIRGRADKRRAAIVDSLRLLGLTFRPPAEDGAASDGAK